MPAAISILYFLGIYSIYIFSFESALIAFPKKHPVDRWQKIITHPITFYLTILVVLLANRLPSMLLPWDLNPDESNMLAQAITLIKDPVYWRSVDGTTQGPFNIILLTLPALFGHLPNYFIARTLAIILFLSSLLCITRVLLLFFGTDRVKIALFLPVLFFAYTDDPDFIHFSSEYPPLFYFCFTLWLISESIFNKGLTKRIRALCLTISGMFFWIIPLAKLQAAYLACFSGLFALWLIFTESNDDTKGKFHQILYLASGFIIFGLLLIYYLYHFKIIDQVLVSYVMTNLNYIKKNLSPSTLLFAPSFGWRLFIITVCAALLSCGSSIFLCTSQKIKNLSVFTVLCIIAIFTVLTPGQTFAHYLLFLVIPLGILPGTVFAAIITSLPIDCKRYTDLSKSITICFIFVSIAPWLVTISMERNFSYMLQSAINAEENHVVHRIRKLTRPGDTMAVWGWMSRYYVEAGIPSATRDCHTELELGNRGPRDWYRARYVKDIRHSKPAVFVDAVAKSSFLYTDPQKFGYETFQELAQYINANYLLVDDVDGNRIFLRKDLASRLKREPS